MGVLDVGSNTVHLLLVDARYGAAPIPASKHKAPLRLAEHTDADGVIDQELIDALVAFIDHSQTIAEDQGATEIITFATSAIRSAGNGDAIIEEIRRRTGIVIDVLTGEEEARLTFLAVRRWFGWSSGQLLVLDIGGGSLELATGPDEEPEVAISLPLASSYSLGSPAASHRHHACFRVPCFSRTCCIIHPRAPPRRRPSRRACRRRWRRS